MGRLPPESCTLCRRRAGGFRCRIGERIGDRLTHERSVHTFRGGEPVFIAGTPAHSLFVVRSGRVKVFRTSRDGEEQVLRLLGPGELLGYRPVLAGETYGASARAVEDSTLCIIPAVTLRELVRELPDLAVDLLAKLAMELRISEELMMDLVHRPVRQRVARLLLMLLEDNRRTPMPERLESRHLRRQDMARMVGTTPETFSRVLRALAQRGAIGLGRDHLTVLDAAALRQVSGVD